MFRASNNENNPPLSNSSLNRRIPQSYNAQQKTKNQTHSHESLNCSLSSERGGTLNTQKSVDNNHLEVLLSAANQIGNQSSLQAQDGRRQSLLMLGGMSTSNAGITSSVVMQHDNISVGEAGEHNNRASTDTGEDDCDGHTYREHSRPNSDVEMNIDTNDRNAERENTPQNSQGVDRIASQLSDDAPVEIIGQIGIYSEAQRQQLNDYCTRTADIERVTADMTLMLPRLTDLNAVMLIAEFHKTSFKNSVISGVIIPNSFSWLLQSIVNATVFGDVLEEIDQHPDELNAALDMIPAIVPKVLYACNKSLVLYLKQFEGRNDPELSGKELNRLKSSLRKRASDIFLKVELSIYGEELQKEMFAMFTAKRLAAAALKAATVAVVAEQPAPPVAAANRNDQLNLDADDIGTDIQGHSSSSNLSTNIHSERTSPHRDNINANRRQKDPDDDEDDSDDGKGPALHEGRLTDYFFNSYDYIEYVDNSRNIHIVVTETDSGALPLDEQSGTDPVHISCIVGGGKDGLELALSIVYPIKISRCSGKYAKLKSITFLLPSEFEKRYVDRFTSEILGCLSYQCEFKGNENERWQCFMHDFMYDRIDPRQLAIFIKNPSEYIPELIPTVAERATVGYKRATELFGSLEMSTGVHALPLIDTLHVINQIGVADGDTFWEIGGGECKLACAFSAAANGGLVVVTELHDIADQLIYKINSLNSTKKGIKRTTSSVFINNNDEEKWSDEDSVEGYSRKRKIMDDDNLSDHLKTSRAKQNKIILGTNSDLEDDDDEDEDNDDMEDHDDDE